MITGRVAKDVYVEVQMIGWRVFDVWGRACVCACAVRVCVYDHQVEKDTS